MNGWTFVRPGDRLVVVVAHPDDETFGCGSLIALAVSQGAQVSLICATRGESGERRSDPITDSWPLGLLRESELCQAGIVLGVDAIEILDHVDSGFSGPSPDGALIDVPVADLAHDLRDRLAAIEPDVLLTLDGSDGHRDHCHLRDALSLAAQDLPRPVRLVHSCLARSLMQEWAAAMRSHAPEREHLATADDLGRADDELIPIDTSRFLAIRERAIGCHLSQRSPFDGLPPMLRHRFLTTDHVVEIPTRWTSPQRTHAHEGAFQ